jgi:crossover junction endodeoxyribonuclease RusA
MNPFVKLQYPMSANRYWTKSKGRIIVSLEGRIYRTAVAYAYKQANIPKLTGKVSLTIGLCQIKPKDAEKRLQKLGEDWQDTVRAIDTDNSLKPMLDALKNIAFEDDKQVKEIHVVWLEPIENGGVYIKVKPFERMTVEDFLND